MTGSLILAQQAFPIAGVWLYVFGLIVAIVLIPIFPFILRHRRRKAQKELHEKIEKARSEILADGKVEGPKGPYVPHEPWAVGRTGQTPRGGRPKQNSYHAGPWPE